MKLSLAHINQAEAIVQLINIAYRGDIGWTKENGLVNGNRTRLLDIVLAIHKTTTCLLVCMQGDAIIGCICLEKEKGHVYLGLFSVDPTVQGKGIGSQILLQAEAYAAVHFQSKKLMMVVVSQRTELIDFYMRRGYVKTGRVEQYPKNIHAGTPKVANLTIEYLEKIITDDKRMR